MTTQEVADKLVYYCQSGDWEKAQKELYAENAVSIEPEATPAFEKETHGLQAIIEKGRKFDAMVDKVHGMVVSAPLVADHSFVFVLDMDITMKEKGRMHMKELCIYQVKDGKIIAEQFFM